MANQFASAGNANEKSGTAENPIGLYRNPDGKEVGVLDPAAGDAVIRQGFTLVKEGVEAAMTPESKDSKTEEPKKGDK